MAEATTVGLVLWVRLVADDGGKIIFRIGERDDNARLKLVELDPVTYSLSRTHPMFSAMESTLYTSLMYEYRVAVTADDGAVTALSMASMRYLARFDSTEERRRTTAEGPTREAEEELAERRLREAENQVAMAHAEVLEMHNRRLLRQPQPLPRAVIPREENP